MGLNGTDIASWQAGIRIASLSTTEIVVVKATESTTYVNDYFDGWARDVLAAGKLLGCYHFARPGDAIKQAKFFLSEVKAYYGKAVMCLDWEEDAIDLGPEWAKTWLDYVYKATGCKGMVYMSKSVANAWDWSDVASAGYGLWVAQYPSYEPTGYRKKSGIWTDSSGFGAWKSWAMFQYTSCGLIAGYSGQLDLDYYDGTAGEWTAIAKGSTVRQAVSKVVQNAKADTSTPKWQLMVDEAVRICEDDSHGYSQYRRWWPDFDCSSLMYWCADKAGYGVDMTDPRWTGSMVEDFTACGFKKLAFDRSKLVAGDILLSHDDSRQHTELYIGNGKTAGAHIAETGGIDGATGDQTGNEISVSALSWTPQWILRPPDSGQQKKTTTKGVLYTCVTPTFVRKSRKVAKSNIVGKLAKGEQVRLTMVKRAASGTVWGHVCEGRYKGRVVAVEFKGVKRLVKAGVKTIDQLAHEVIAGDWGNGQARIDALTKKGYDAVAVQARVNEILEG